MIVSERVSCSRLRFTIQYSRLTIHEMRKRLIFHYYSWQPVFVTPGATTSTDTFETVPERRNRDVPLLPRLTRCLCWNITRRSLRKSFLRRRLKTCRHCRFQRLPTPALSESSQGPRIVSVDQLESKQTRVHLLRLQIFIHENETCYSLQDM